MRRLAPLVLTAILSVGCADKDPVSLQNLNASVHDDSGARVEVMTRNLYLGANLDPIFAAPAAQIPFVAAQVWGAIQATYFPRRAGVLADEIARAQPDLVGLQEVVLYRVQSPGDIVLGGSSPATTVRYDFLELLLDSLAARGLDYDAVASNTNSDVELPVYTGQGPLPFDDVRYTDRDVIIARVGVVTANPQGGVFAARVPAPVGATTIFQLRGWSSVDAVVDGAEFRFVNAHLEVQGFEPVQVAQANELIGILDASPLPVVLVGDMNSAADGTQTASYSQFMAAGFADAWHQSSAGFTCCHLPDLSNAMPTLDQRLDLILTRGFLDLNAKAHIIGDKPVDSASGIWASDHAGVVARLTIRER